MLSDLLLQLGVAYSALQVLRLPTHWPHWLDLRRLLFIGWITIDGPGYLATAKVHYRPSYNGLSGSRVHQLAIWRDTGQTQMDMAGALYRHFRGNTTDRLDAGGREFLNLILEYFK